MHFAATQGRVIEQLEQAKRSVRYARKEFESLKFEKALSPEYQKAYAKMAESLHRTEQAIAEIMNENLSLEWEPVAGRTVHHHTPVALEIVTAIRRTIEKINAAEMRFFDHCKSTLETLRKQDLSGLIDWSMPVHYELSARLDPGPGFLSMPLAVMVRSHCDYRLGFICQKTKLPLTGICLRFTGAIPCRRITMGTWFIASSTTV